MIITQLLNPGKSCFLYYLLLCLLQEQRTVALQLRNIFVLFEPSGVQIFDANFLYGYNIPNGTWALTDSHASSPIPCSAFLAACDSDNAWIVQSTSPSADMWRGWSEEHDAHIYWMEVFPLEELIALG